jgi:acetyl-CoA carboxylase biotin carboxyl carrier protein
MDLRKLKTLIDLVSESNISELEITEAEGRVRIVKGGPAATLAVPQVQVAAAAVPLPATVVAAAPAPATAAESPAAPAGKVIKSPMVGTFYRSASPGGKAFVELGDQIKTGPAGVHHRGHEDHERDRSRLRRQGRATALRQRRGGGVRSAAVHCRIGDSACSRKS